MGSDITSGVLYAPLPALTEGTSAQASIFCVDRQKWNMLWLTEPRADSIAIDILAGEPLAADINRFMDKIAREHLRKPPLAFIKYWNSQVAMGIPAMTSSCGPDIAALMECRAQDAHERLYGIEVVDNVVYAKFGRAA